MRIPPEKIDEVRNATDIIDLVSAFVNLKKRGKNYVGLCPFHSEKTPSFTVSAERQVYHCFGCGVGGNVFTFVMEHEKVSFPEAVRYLAERAGISLPAYSPEAEAIASEHETLYNVMRIAGLFFYHNLQSAEGKTALEYFHSRGFRDETIKNFGLGYSLNSWDGLIKHAEEQNIKMDYLEKAGLVRRREDGSGYFDYFRGRAMFPIFSTSGRVIAFGARKLYETDQLGKYINSPETPIYNKSRILYGIFQAKDALRGFDNAILVEGYADLISVFQGGVENVVASSGTALTEGQIQLIGRYTKNITLVYDADSAGFKATMRGVDLIIEGGLDVKVAELPQGEDPDSFVKKFGGEEFKKLMANSISFIDFKARTFQREGMFNSPEGRTQAIRSIVQSIAKMKDELKRNFYIKEVSQKYDIYETVLYRELDQWLPRKERSAYSRASQRVPVFDVPIAEVTPPKPSEISAAERDLIKIMLEKGGEMVDFIFEHLGIEEFSDERARKIASIILNRHHEHVDMNTIMNEIIEDQELRSIITDVILSRYELSKGWSELEEIDVWDIANKALVAVKKKSIGKKVEEIQRQLKEATQKGGEEIALVEEHQRLLREIRELETNGFLNKKEQQ